MGRMVEASLASSAPDRFIRQSAVAIVAAVADRGSVIGELAEVGDRGYNDSERCIDICDDWNVPGSILFRHDLHERSPSSSREGRHSEYFDRRMVRGAGSAWLGNGSVCHHA